MVDIFHEVDEDLRREKLEQAWKKFGPWIIGAAAGIIVATAIVVFWRNYTHSQQVADAEKYMAAVKDEAPIDAAKALENFSKIANDANSGYSGLAQLQQAAGLVQQGKIDDAIGIYKALAVNTKVDSLVRDLGKVYAALYQVDKVSLAEIEAELSPLVSKSNPWRHSAREILALAAIKADDKDRARVLLTELVDDAAAPGGIKQRAQLILTSLMDGTAKEDRAEQPAPKTN